ncbi:MAG: hypothetical protein K2K36_07935 [Muribaculaceae bacterium]|nr:hypothetical protein [Muribaculaceae bacterium]
MKNIQRVGGAAFELTFQKDYDHVVVNDTLPEAIAQIEGLMSDYLKS